MGWCHNHHGYNLPLAIRYRLEHGIPLSAHAEPIRRVLYIAPRKNIPGVGENGCPHGKLDCRDNTPSQNCSGLPLSSF